MSLQTILIIYCCFAVLSTIAVLLSSLCFIQTLQEKEYDGRAYLRYLKTEFRNDWLPFIIITVVALLLKLAYAFLYSSNHMLAVISVYGADIIYICMIFSMYLSFRRTSQGITFDGRTKMIMAVLLLMIGFCSGFQFVRFNSKFLGNLTLWQYMRRYLLYYMPGLLLPLFVWAASLITAPFFRRKRGAPLHAESESNQSEEKAER